MKKKENLKSITNNTHETLVRLAGLLVAVTSIALLHGRLVVMRGSDYIINPGVSFGTRLPGVTWIALLLLIIFSRWWLATGGLGGWLVLTGGWVNWIDRMANGGVNDYWNLPMLGVKNNLPDWLITAGVITIMVKQLRKEVNHE